MTDDNKFGVGDIVLALAGRDADRLFVVTDILDEDYVFIADGKSRKADTPKKKKVKHIKSLRKVEADFIQGLNLKGGRLTNSVLKKIIAEFKDPKDEEI